MERERKLASIQRIVALDPIEGADRIEMATVLGWHVVVEKGLYKPGSLVIYCEVDSLLPLKPEFAFLEKGNKPKRQYWEGKEIYGHRIKTIRLRGQVSQGIVFPLSIIPAAALVPHSTFSVGINVDDSLDHVSSDPPEGLDVTEIMGVHKYEMPLPTELAGKARGGWPGYLPKTDEPRLQANPSLLERYADETFYVTEKIDGSSVTFIIKNDEMHCVGRTIDWLDDGKNTIWRLAKELDIEGKMRARDLQERVALQGEIYGSSIQSNPLKQSKVSIRFYNAYDFAKGEYIGYFELKALLEAMGLDMVPVLDDQFRLLPTVDQMVAYATQKSIINPNVMLEGIVLRPINELKDPDIGRVSFKVISPEYLLKHDD